MKSLPRSPFFFPVTAGKNSVAHSCAWQDEPLFAPESLPLTLLLCLLLGVISDSLLSPASYSAKRQQRSLPETKE